MCLSILPPSSSERPFSGFYRAKECPGGSSYPSQDNDLGDEDKHGSLLCV